MGITKSATDLVHGGAASLERPMPGEIEQAMYDRTRPPDAFIPKGKPTTYEIEHAAQELAWETAANAYTPDQRGPQSMSAFEQRDTRAPVAPVPPADTFDAAAAARRILDDIGSPFWDLHHK